MGNTSSNETTKVDSKVCVDCHPSKQKDLPVDDTISSSGGPCALLYDKVSTCMKEHDGLISPCSKEWAAFQKCHEDQKSGDVITW